MNARISPLSRTAWAAALVIMLFPALFGQADFSVDSGSDGSDGALNLVEAGTVIFDPATFDPPLDADGDGVYHFTTIHIAQGVNVKLSSQILGRRPVIFLATGAVTIDGVLDLAGAPGHTINTLAHFSIAGAGGYDGGAGTSSPQPPYRGNGPGGGGISPDSARGGGGGGHAIAGNKGTFNAGLGGRSYGNHYLLPLIGGSGGGGGGGGINNGGGGGGGGGAILIASNDSIRVNGTITADGGGGGLASGTSRGGGGGSGGAIRLLAPTLTGNGNLTAVHGTGVNGSGNGARGRIRLEAFFRGYTGGSNPSPKLSTPGLIHPSPALAPVRVTSVAGVPVPNNPSGDFHPADLTLDEVGPVTLEVAASGVPVGTIVNLTMWTESGSTIQVDSSPLAGSLTQSTASATVNLPHGFSRFFVEATWTP